MNEQDLVELWIRSKSSMPNFKTNKDYRAYETAPENINAFLNYFAPFDLYTKPDSSPAPIDYETSGVNVSREMRPMPFTVFAKGKPKSELSLVRPDPLTNQEGVYNHELGHFMDERIDPEKGTPYGFKNDPRYERYVSDLADRMQEDLKIPRKKALRFARREAPANIAEDLFRKKSFTF